MEEEFIPIDNTQEDRSQSIEKCELFLVKENKLNSEIFSYDNYSLNPSIDLDPWHYFDHSEFELRLDEFELVGWCDATNLKFKPKNDGSFAIMVFHKPEGRDIWFHFNKEYLK
jgi:hypothetical protein